MSQEQLFKNLYSNNEDKAGSDNEKEDIQMIEEHPEAIAADQQPEKSEK